MRRLYNAACVALLLGLGSWSAAVADDLEAVGNAVRADGPPNVVLVAPDGLRVLLQKGKVARLVEAASGKEVGKALELPAGSVAFAFSGDGQFLLGFTGHGAPVQEVRVWNAAGEPVGTPLRIDRFTLGMRPLVSNDGKWVVAFTGARGCRLFNVATGMQQGEPFDVGPGPARATLAPDGRTMAVVNDAGYRLFDVQSGRALSGPLTPPPGRSLPSGPFQPFSELRFSPDGKLLTALVAPAKPRPGSGAVLSSDVALWDAATGKPLPQTFPFATHACGSYDLSPDGKLIAVGGEERTATLSSVATGERLREVKHDLARQPGTAKFPALLTAVRFSPDGTLLATACVGEPMGKPGAPLGDVRLWDVASGKQVGKTLTFRNPVYQIAFTADGKSLLLGATARDPRIELDGGVSGAFLIGDAASNEASLWKLPARTTSPGETPK